MRLMWLMFWCGSSSFLMKRVCVWNLLRWLLFCRCERGFVCLVGLVVEWLVLWDV